MLTIKLTDDAMRHLGKQVRERKMISVIVSGNTRSGKSTLAHLVYRSLMSAGYTVAIKDDSPLVAKHPEGETYTYLDDRPMDRWENDNRLVEIIVE